MSENKTLEEWFAKGDETITSKQGYYAMLKVLEHYYKLTDSIDLTDILSGGGIMSDGYPLDKAFWYYWVEAVDQVKEQD